MIAFSYYTKLLNNLAMDNILTIASASLSTQRLTNFNLLPTITQHWLLTSPCFLYQSQKLSNLYVA